MLKHRQLSRGWSRGTESNRSQSHDKQSQVTDASKDVLGPRIRAMYRNFRTVPIFSRMLQICFAPCQVLQTIQSPQRITSKALPVFRSYHGGTEKHTRADGNRDRSSWIRHNHDGVSQAALLWELLTAKQHGCKAIQGPTTMTIQNRSPRTCYTEVRPRTPL